MESVMLPGHHSNYSKEMQSLFYNISSAADTTYLPTYTTVDDMTQTIQNLHMSDLLEYDDDGSSTDGPNDIDVTRMLPGAANNDYDIGGSPFLQGQIKILMGEYNDIFSYNVKGKAMSVPPMQFSVNVEQWESNPNRLPSRHISVEKHEALTKMIDDLLELQVIQPSKATAWSQVHLIRKPTGGWRFTVDYRGLNKVISNEGWQIPNMRDMLMRIGHQRPKCFAVADLTSGFFQMPLHETCRKYTAFISFRGIYEWTRVPMGLLPSANYFQKSMGVYVLNDLLYKICEVYIDDMLILGSDDDNFISNVRTVFQRCREKNVSLNAKKLTIGKDKVQFCRP
jgi:hypothetical protein